MHDTIDAETIEDGPVPTSRAPLFGFQIDDIVTWTDSAVVKAPGTAMAYILVNEGEPLIIRDLAGDAALVEDPNGFEIYAKLDELQPMLTD